MRAAVLEAFGGTDRLTVRDVPRPEPGPGEVLVRVRAAAMNPLDAKLRAGRFRLVFRVKPPAVLGFDVAGEVEALGPGAAGFAVGDAVFGALSRPGAHAEAVAVPASLLLRKPASLSFEQAAAIPAAGVSALQGLRDLGGLRAGQRVLVNGAGGGIGTFAVAIARAAGARVTAVSSAGKRELVCGLGADEHLDYAREDFTRREAAFDLVFDVVPSRSFPECRSCLAPAGVYVTTLPGPGPFFWIAATSVAPWAFGGRRCRALFLKPSTGDLAELVRLAEAGQLRPIVGEVFPLEKIREAHAAMESGHASGKIVVTP